MKRLVNTDTATVQTLSDRESGIDLVNYWVKTIFLLLFLKKLYQVLYLILSLNREGRLGTTDDFAASFLHFFMFSTALWALGKLQVCPFPVVVFPLLPPSALSSSPFHCALEDGFGQT